MRLRTLRQALALAVRARPGLVAAYAGFVVVAGATPVAVAWLPEVKLQLMVAGPGRGDFVLPVLGLAAAGVVATTAGDTARYFGAEIARAVRLESQERL